METLNEFVSGLSTSEIVLGVIVIIFAAAVIVMIAVVIALFISWLNFFFMPVIKGEGVVTMKQDRPGGNEYVGAVSMPAERFVYLKLHGKIRHCLVSRKQFDLLEPGDNVKLLFVKGFFGGIKVTEILQ